MLSKKMVWALMAVFAFLSISMFISNMPEKKDRHVIEKISAYFPYELTKTIGGLDLVNKNTGEKLKIDNAKVFLAFDDLLKKWGRSHLQIKDSTLLILDDENRTVDTMHLNEKELKFVKDFFFK
ncbi:hypothetical protein NNO_0552 [Hydrogenimonas sp.]|nr:hypothetical protein NNO_0552 [Hydrogenimonas sp.]